MEKTCCMLGYMPDNSKLIPQAYQDLFSMSISRMADRAYAAGYRTFLFSILNQLDLLIADSILDMQDGTEDIIPICRQPLKVFSDGWPKEALEHYHNLNRQTPVIFFDQPVFTIIEKMIWDAELVLIAAAPGTSKEECPCLHIAEMMGKRVIYQQLWEPRQITT